MLRPGLNLQPSLFNLQHVQANVLQNLRILLQKEEGKRADLFQRLRTGK